MSFINSRLALILFFLICLINLGKATEPLKIAVIGDYGTDSDGAKKVSALVHSWDPDRIITTGDNIYGDKGKIHAILDPMYGEDRKTMLPCMGNHDFGQENNPQPYFDYFPATGGKYYYDVVLKDIVHFFILCSDYRCPDGIWPGSKQLLWAEETIKESTAPWKIVVLHHPFYSSAMTGWNSKLLQENCERKIKLPFYDWGVSAVLSGHLHLYERFMINKDGNPETNGVPYITNGAGGDGRYKLCDGPRLSICSYDQEDGAMHIKATPAKLSFRFISTSEKTIDKFTLHK